MILATFLTWDQWSFPVSRSSQPNRQIEITPPAASAVSSVPTSRVPDDESRQAFSQSLSRLSDAISEFQPESAQDVLRRVAVQNPWCAFQWNNGQPALLYREKDSIAGTLEKCAAAVEKFGEKEVRSK